MTINQFPVFEKRQDMRRHPNNAVVLEPWKDWANQQSISVLNLWLAEIPAVPGLGYYYEEDEGERLHEPWSVEIDGDEELRFPTFEELIRFVEFVIENKTIDGFQKNIHAGDSIG